eukprot:2594307-Amphidinium_carterae.2
MLPAGIIGSTHDATIEVHLFVAPVTVHASRVPRFDWGQRGTAELFKPCDALLAPVTSFGLAGGDGLPPTGKPRGIAASAPADAAALPKVHP